MNLMPREENFVDVTVLLVWHIVLEILWAYGVLDFLYTQSAATLFFLGGMHIIAVVALLLPGVVKREQAVSTLVTLGLIGTLIGLAKAFMGIDVSMVGNAAAMKSLLVSFLSNVGLAVYTTLYGAVLSILLSLSKMLPGVE